jgi:metal-sulfur cluster biosynthetic enzyme
MSEKIAETKTNELSSEALFEWLKPVMDPELNLSLVELGLIYEAVIEEENHVFIRMTLTSPGCPVGPELVGNVKKRALEHPGVKGAEVEVVWEPKWDPSTMASEDCKDVLGIW